jgi:Leucine-rich repeat (LRR) protein
VLSENPIGDEGAQLLMNAIQANGKLRGIDFSGCDFSERTVPGWKTLLRSQFKLLHVSLERNRFAEEDVKCFMHNEPCSQVLLAAVEDDDLRRVYRILATIYSSISRRELMQTTDTGLEGSLRFGNTYNFTTDEVNIESLLFCAVMFNREALARELLKLGGNPHSSLLYATAQKLRVLPTIVAHMKELKSLSLAGMGLAEVPAEISQFENLLELDLRFNELRSLPDWHSSFAKLKEILVRFFSVF